MAKLIEAERPQMRAIFLDRDGVICQNRDDHVKSWEEFQFVPGARKGLAMLNRLGWPIIVVTNQAIIGRTIVPASVVEDIHHRMVAEVVASGGRIDSVIYCPHRPENRCACRKPEPGMLLQAAHQMGVELRGSYLIGDAATDLLAGQRVGCHTILVLTGRGLQQLLPVPHLNEEGFTVARDLLDAATYISDMELGIMDDPRPAASIYLAGRSTSFTSCLTFR